MTRSKYLQPNYYDILGVDRSASTDDIKAAYRKLGNATTTCNVSTLIVTCSEANTLVLVCARSKYDMEMFGVSAAPGHTDRVVVGTGNYKPMSSEDVHELFGGLNEFERFTTAQYHRQRSHIAPAAIGRRATNFAERKQFRAANVKLPAQSATMAWLAFPVALMALWGLNLKSIQNQSKKY
ncbi:hypothetical protein ON010_g1410 [Phytophthora cinnamomi]|nr:hypothetical protein ON010_g1410 [Phytophthora cinnamomi]